MRTFSRAVSKIVDIVTETFAPGTSLRVQVLHADNLPGAHQLRDLFDKTFDCSWLPIGPIAPVLGAHTGPGLVGAAYAAMSVFPALP
jgi:fatty acid-binding protein DegV